MIKFKSVKYRNFLSTGNKFTEINLCDTRTTLMIGRNGAGKSTFMDAISYGLFGKPFRKINIGQLVNSINKKRCQVEVEFQTNDKNYIVKRHLKPNKFEVWVDGKMLDQHAAAKDHQDFLERYILKMNEKSFRQIVVLGSGSFIPFMRLSAADRRAIIEELLDIQIFSVMNDLMKKRVIDVKIDIAELSHDVVLLDQQVSLQEEHMKSLQIDKQEEIERQREDISGSAIQISVLQESIAALQKGISSYPDLKGKKTKLTGYQHQFSERRKQILDQIEAITTLSECPTCLQSIDKKYRDDVSDKLIKTCDKLHDALKMVFQGMDETKENISFMEAQMQSINDKQNSISSINRYIDKIHKDISKTLNDDEVVDSSELKISRDKLNCIRKEKFDRMGDLHHHRTVVEMLKDGGIKSVIIRNYLPVINQLINKYLSSLNFYVKFELDESFNETIKSRGRDKFGYASFSEGEKMRIDLALLFTWREVARLKSSVSTNLLILDEIFDGSLDRNGVDDFLGILNSLEEDTNTFVISHKSGEILDKFGKVVKVEKVKQFSKIAKS